MRLLLLTIRVMEIEELVKKFSDVEHCPIRNVVAHFSSKWAILLLLALGEAHTLRFSDLGRILPDISAKVLSTTLKSLERDGLVERTVLQTVPPSVYYSITAKGLTLVPILAELSRWARAQ